MNGILFVFRQSVLAVFCLKRLRTFALAAHSGKSLRLLHPCGLFLTAKTQGRKEEARFYSASLSQSESPTTFKFVCNPKNIHCRKNGFLLFFPSIGMPGRFFQMFLIRIDILKKRFCQKRNTLCSKLFFHPELSTIIGPKASNLGYNVFSCYKQVFIAYRHNPSLSQITKCSKKKNSSKQPFVP
jgi:hypothetical protein